MDNHQETTVINNKRVLKNTVFLYIRMLFVMLVGLYTVRIVLRELGVVDYGINNVVGSIVAMCSFLTSSLTAVCNRFFAKEMVSGDAKSLNRCFCLNVTTFFVLMVLAVIVLETFGIWYLNNKMVIPVERMGAAHVVYQLSILTLCFSFISIPYNSLIIIHERMSFYAYLGVFEAIAKLLVAYMLVIASTDKLVLYAFLSVLIIAIVSGGYIVYCRRNFKESKYMPYWNQREFKEIFSFVGWYFFGSMSSVLKSSGLNLLINAFFTPSINAARAVATQVEGAIRRFSDGFFSASKPQIYKAYSNNEHDGLNKLIIRTTIVCSYLMAFISLPVFFNAESTLTIWLQNVPDKAVIFLQLLIIDSILNLTSEPIILTILATGQQKCYQIVEFLLRFLTLPISYVFLFWGYDAEITMVVSIILSISSVFLRAFLLYKAYSNFNFQTYALLLIKMMLGYGVLFIVVFQLSKLQLDAISYFFISSSSAIVLLSLLNYCLLERSDRNLLWVFISSKIGIIKK